MTPCRHIRSFSSRYNVYRFGGAKYVVLTTTSWLGGKSDFLGMAYLSVGGGALAFCLLFASARAAFPRVFGDLGRLTWKRPLPPASPKEA